MRSMARPGSRRTGSSFTLSWASRATATNHRRVGAEVAARAHLVTRRASCITVVLTTTATAAEETGPYYTKPGVTYSVTGSAVRVAQTFLNGHTTLGLNWRRSLKESGG
jgi:hypothetical protein